MKDFRGTEIEPGDKVVVAGHARVLREEIVDDLKPWKSMHPGGGYGFVQFKGGGSTTCDHVAVIEKAATDSTQVQEAQDAGFREAGADYAGRAGR